MGKIVSVHSFRGGTGKSNATANIAVLVALAGKRVGVIDTDIHSPGIHIILGLDESRVTFALNDHLWGRCGIEKAAYDVTACTLGRNQSPADPRTRLFLIPSSVKTGDIARILREGYDIGKLTDGLRELIHALELDYLFIDTHPGVNEETLLSTALSDLLLIILRPDNQDLQGTAVTLELARRLDVNEILIIINKVPEGVDWESLRIQVETAYQAPVIGMLPLSTEMAQLASSGVFAIRHPNHPITLGLKRIADRVMG
jgi:septum site-determining protein MinD